jgi:hypothetical protein
MITKDNPYIQIVLSFIPKVLTNLDRDINSPTYGSFDRNYWHFKIRNFSSAVLQQAVLPLTLCYKNDFEGNIYYDNKLMRQWAIASLEYWSKIQNRDGSYDEYWKGEGSFPATAFSTFSATETYLLLHLNNSHLISAMDHSIDFLSRRVETFSANQEVASIAAIYNMFLITNDKKFFDITVNKLEKLKSMQTQDGFFSEHGGPDVGYSSVALEYLSILYEKTGRGDIKNMCNSLIDFLSYFIHPDGTSGGQYGSRNTEYFMLGGLESCLSFNQQCTAMLEALTSNIIRKQFINIGIDERYFLHYIGYSLARALLKYQHRTGVKDLPYKRNMKKLFKEANLYMLSNASVYLIISLFKGGAYRLYIDGKLLLEDTGYRILNGRKIFLTEVGGNFRYQIEQNIIIIAKNFYQKKYIAITPFRSFLLFLYSLLFGNLLWVFFRNNFINGAKKSNMLLRRKFLINNDNIIVEDEITNVPRAKLIKNPRESIKNIPSSKFFQIQELEDKAPTESYDIYKSLRLKTFIDFKSQEVKLSIIEQETLPL